jgi:hypothetical protein
VEGDAWTTQNGFETPKMFYDADATRSIVCRANQLKFWFNSAWRREWHTMLAGCHCVSSNQAIAGCRCSHSSGL